MPSMNGYAPESAYRPQTTAKVSTAGFHSTSRANTAAATASDSAASSRMPTTDATG